MKKDQEDYKYLLRSYSQVDDYLADTPEKQENLPEVVIAFCVVTEKLFKIRLHKENPVLVYDTSKLRENDALTAVIKRKETSIETVRIGEIISRYKLMFENEFSDDEMQVLIDIYNIRNHFIHSYRSDDNILTDSENIVKKMGTVWEKISIQAESIFGKDLIKANKPKRKYSEEELEKVLTEEVRKKIQPIGGSEFGLGMVDGPFHIDIHQNPASVRSVYEIPTVSLGDLGYRSPSSVLGYSGEKCPRCGQYTFSLAESSDSVYDILGRRATTVAVYAGSRNFSDLYKCTNCNLELTRKEYEIAKNLKK